MAWSPLTLGLISEKMDNGVPVFSKQSFKVTNLLLISLIIVILNILLYLKWNERLNSSL